MAAGTKRTSAPDLHKLADLHGRAVDASRAGAPAVAERLLHRALSAFDDEGRSPDEVTLRMQVLITLAKVESELRGVEAGLTRLHAAAELLALDPKPVVLAALHNQRGTLLGRTGRFADAIECFNEAERYFRFATPRDRSAVLLNRGTARMMLGNVRGAASDLQRCAAVAEQGGLDSLSRMAKHNAGYLQFVLGDMPSALATMAAADQTENRGVALLDRARVLAEAGLIREADEVLAEAADIARRDRLAQDLGEIELERARCALVADDIMAARHFAASARSRFRRRGSDSWRRWAELTLLQGDLAAGRPGRRLLAPALRVQAEFSISGLRVQGRTAGLIAAEAALSAGDVSTAASLVAQLGPVNRRDPITARLHSRYVRAALHRAEGRRTTASRQARAGLQELSAYQSTFGSIDLQTAAAVHGRRLADLDVSIALESGKPAAVLVAAEFARAASNRLPVVRPPADREGADLLAELRQVAESLHAVQDRTESQSLQRRRRELEGRIAARGWTLGGPGETRDAASVDVVCATARSTDCAVVTYVQSDGILHAVVVGASVRLHALGDAATIVERVRRARADLDVLAQPQLPAAMRRTVRASFDRSMSALDESLIRPLGAEDRRLAVVSTGALGQLPWGCLPSLLATPVVVAPSATAWVTAVRAPRRRTREVVALCGPGIPSGDREVAGVRLAWPDADVRTGPEADRAALVSALGKASVVHVAAHGTHHTENAVFSSLRMTDGLVFAHELDRTRRGAEHVVLSACELGLATVRPGDEAIGLTSVLLRLGTRSVVAGVARVNDEATASVMTAYHRELASGSDSAHALATAIAGADDVAPFVCFGSAWSTSGVFGADSGPRTPDADLGGG